MYGCGWISWNPVPEPTHVPVPLNQLSVSETDVLTVRVGPISTETKPSKVPRGQNKSRWIPKPAAVRFVRCTYGQQDAQCLHIPHLRVSHDLQPTPFILQSLATLLRLPQHLATIVQVAIHVTHGVALQLHQSVFHFRQAVLEAQTEATGRGRSRQRLEQLLDLIHPVSARLEITAERLHLLVVIGIS